MDLDQPLIPTRPTPARCAPECGQPASVALAGPPHSFECRNEACPEYGRAAFLDSDNGARVVDHIDDAHPAGPTPEDRPMSDAQQWICEACGFSTTSPRATRTAAFRPAPSSRTSPDNWGCAPSAGQSKMDFAPSRPPRISGDPRRRAPRWPMRRSCRAVVVFFAMAATRLPCSCKYRSASAAGTGDDGTLVDPLDLRRVEESLALRRVDRDVRRTAARVRRSRRAGPCRPGRRLRR